LSDDKTKQIYDKYGKRGLEAHEKGVDPEAAGFGAGGGGFDFGGGGAGGTPKFHFSGSGPGGAGFDPRMMFDQMFAGGSGGGGNSFGGFNVNFDGSGGGFGGGFEQMFTGGGFGGGQPGGRRGRQQQHHQQREAPELFPKNDPSGIAPLGKAKFPDAKSKYIWVVVFYENNSQACASIKPSLESFTSKVRGTFKVGAVNCKRGDADMKFCREQGLEMHDLPSFGVVVNGEISIFEGDDGNRSPSMKALHDFAVENLPFNLVQMINHPSVIEERLHHPAKEQKKLGSILLLTDKFETGSKYASLAYHYRDSFMFGESRARTLSMAQHFNVKKYPTLIAFLPKHGTTNDFDLVKLEDAKGQDIEKWIESLLSKRSGNSQRRRSR